MFRGEGGRRRRTYCWSVAVGVAVTVTVVVAVAEGAVAVVVAEPVAVPVAVAVVGRNSGRAAASSSAPIPTWLRGSGLGFRRFSFSIFSARFAAGGRRRELGALGFCVLEPSLGSSSSSSRPPLTAY
jgi:hypothetical protein